MPRGIHARPSAETRFWRKVNKQGPRFGRKGRCWLWQGSLSEKGYGRFWVQGKLDYAHRWAYGLVPTGLELDHLCRRRACVRRSHLEPVTGSINCRRGNTGKWPRKGLTQPRNLVSLSRRYGRAA